METGAGSLRHLGWENDRSYAKRPRQPQNPIASFHSFLFPLYGPRNAQFCCLGRAQASPEQRGHNENRTLDQTAGPGSWPGHLDQVTIGAASGVDGSRTRLRFDLLLECGMCRGVPRIGQASLPRFYLLQSQSPILSRLPPPAGVEDTAVCLEHGRRQGDGWIESKISHHWHTKGLQGVPLSILLSVRGRPQSLPSLIEVCAVHTLHSGTEDDTWKSTAQALQIHLIFSRRQWGMLRCHHCNRNLVTSLRHPPSPSQTHTLCRV